MQRKGIEKTRCKEEREGDMKMVEENVDEKKLDKNVGVEERER